MKAKQGWRTIAVFVILAMSLQGCAIFRTAGTIVGTAVKTTGKVVQSAVGAIAPN